MFGPPEDEPGKCNARLILGDDYGDNDCTFICRLEPDHEGLHMEKSKRFKITWTGDDQDSEPVDIDDINLGSVEPGEGA